MSKLDKFNNQAQEILSLVEKGISEKRLAYILLIYSMTWSFSRLNSFHSCKYCWYKTYIIGEKGLQNAFADYGLIAHEIIEGYLKGELSELDLQDIFEDKFIEAKLDFPPNKFVNLRDSYYNQGMKYFGEIDLLDKYDVLDVELKIDVDINGYKVAGFIDAVLRHKKSGKIIVLDHKSKASFKNKEEELEYARQLYIYSKGVYDKYGEFPSQLVFNRFRKQEYTRIMFKLEGYEEACKWLTDTIEEIKMCTEFPVMYEEDPFFTIYLCNHRDDKEHIQGYVLQLE